MRSNEWKTIKEFPAYQINKDGTIIHTKSGRSKKVIRNNDVLVELKKGGRTYYRKESDLLRATFPPEQGQARWIDLPYNPLGSTLMKALEKY